MNAVKMFFGTCLIFLISAFQSCSELRLSLFGEKIEGKVENVLVEVDKSTQSPTGKYKIAYVFTAQDGETRRPFKGDYYVSKEIAESSNAGEPVPIVYLTSNPLTHRVIGHRSMIWVVIFFIFMVIVAFNLAMIWKQAQHDIARSKRR